METKEQDKKTEVKEHKAWLKEENKKDKVAAKVRRKLGKIKSAILG